MIPSTGVSESRQILTAVVGSRLHGDADPDSNPDLRSIHIEPTMAFVGINQPEPVSNTKRMSEYNHISWEVGHFCNKALEGDIDTLEVLFANEYTYTSGDYESDELIRIRNDFLSQRIARKWTRYAKGRWHDVRHGLETYHIYHGSNPKRLIHKPAFLLIWVTDTLKQVWENGTFNPQHPHPDAVTEWIEGNYLSATFLATLENAISDAENKTKTKPTPLPENPEIERINQYIHNIRALHFFN